MSNVALFVTVLFFTVLALVNAMAPVRTSATPFTEKVSWAEQRLPSIEKPDSKINLEKKVFFILINLFYDFVNDNPVQGSILLSFPKLKASNS